MIIPDPIIVLYETAAERIAGRWCQGMPFCYTLKEAIPDTWSGWEMMAGRDVLWDCGITDGHIESQAPHPVVAAISERVDMCAGGMLIELMGYRGWNELADMPGIEHMGAAAELAAQVVALEEPWGSYHDDWASFVEFNDAPEVTESDVQKMFHLAAQDRLDALTVLP